MLLDDGSFARRDNASWRHKGVARQPTKHTWRGYTIFNVLGVPTAVPGSPAVLNDDFHDEYC